MVKIILEIKQGRKKGYERKAQQKFPWKVHGEGF